MFRRTSLRGCDEPALPFFDRGEDGERAARRRLPQSCGPVEAARGERLPVRAECHGRHVVPVASERQNPSARARLPNPHLPVAPRGGDVAPVRAEASVARSGSVGVQHRDLGRPGHVPDPYRPVAPGGHEPLAVAAEGDRGDLAAVALKQARAIHRPDLPELDRAVPARAGEPHEPGTRRLGRYCPRVAAGAGHGLTEGEAPQNRAIVQRHARQPLAVRGELEVAQREREGRLDFEAGLRSQRAADGPDPDQGGRDETSVGPTGRHGRDGDRGRSAPKGRVTPSRRSRRTRTRRSRSTPPGWPSLPSPPRSRERWPRRSRRPRRSPPGRTDRG